MQKSLEVRNMGLIQSIVFPPGWTETRTTAYSLPGNSWERTFVAPDSEFVYCLVQYRGHALDENDTAVVRGLLKQDPKFIYDESVGPRDVDVTKSLTTLLNNCGNNQVVNLEQGYSGPDYWMRQLRTIRIVGKSVVQVTGSYINENNEALNNHAGLFFDATGNDVCANIQEVHLVVRNDLNFGQYLKDFVDAVLSIKWLADPKAPLGNYLTS